MIQPQSFDVLASSRNGIAKLRALILDLAVRGLLVSQDPNDEPATDLLNKIEIEKFELIKSGRIKKDKDLATIRNIDKPFEIPNSWLWMKIGNSSLFTEYGTSEKSGDYDSGVPVIKMGDIQNGTIHLGGQNKVPATIDGLPQLLLNKFDLLYNRTNSAELVGKTGIYLGEDNEYTFASYLIRIRCSKIATHPMYFNLAMNAPYFRKTQIYPHLKQQCGQANVNGTILKNMLVPIPPIKEQQRIVSKVDELMAICDQLDQRQNHSSTVHQRLIQTLLQSLAQAIDNEAFQKIWSQIAEHFDTLFITEASVDQLKQVILQLAVMGKLVPQDINDEPASELLNRIHAEQSKLVKEGKIREAKDFDPMKSEGLYEIPKNWKWVPFGATVNNHFGGGTPSKANPTYWHGNIYWASVKDIGRSKYVYSTIDKITEEGLSNSSSNLIPPDNLIVVTRMGLGKVSINKVPIAINQDLRALLLTSLSVIDYYYNFLKTHGFEGSGMTVKGIKVDELMNIPFPLPPLEEQKRIVNKVDELMEVCDNLKDRIRHSNKIQENLATAIVEKAVA